MSKVRKTYQAITSVIMTINVQKKDKTIIPIEFTSHNLELGIKGKFSTTDPELIEALESNAEFKNNYGLFSTITENEGVTEEGNTDGLTLSTDDLTPIEGITSVQLAKAYLVENYKEKVTPSSLTTWAEIDKVAAEQGIKFVR